MFLQCLPWHSRCHLVKYSPVSGPGVLFHSKKKRRRKNMFCLLLSWYIFFTWYKSIRHRFKSKKFPLHKKYLSSLGQNTFLSSRGFFFFSLVHRPCFIVLALQGGMPVTQAAFHIVFSLKNAGQLFHRVYTGACFGNRHSLHGRVTCRSLAIQSRVFRPSLIKMHCSLCSRFLQTEHKIFTQTTIHSLRVSADRWFTTRLFPV